MKQKIELKVNDEVWYYDPSMGAREAKITSFEEISGCARLVFREKIMDYMNGKIVTSYHIFKRPEQWAGLVDEMREDARHLELEAREIEERYERD